MEHLLWSLCAHPLKELAELHFHGLYLNNFWSCSKCCSNTLKVVDFIDFIQIFKIHHHPKFFNVIVIFRWNNIVFKVWIKMMRKKNSPFWGEIFNESKVVIISYWMTPFLLDKYSSIHSWSFSAHLLNFLRSDSSLLINFAHSLRMPIFSSSIKLFGNDAKLCWKYVIVLINITWLPILAKLILVGFFPSIEMLFVLRTPALNPFSRKKIQI